MEKYFSREFQLTSEDVNLEILQHTVGDVRNFIGSINQKNAQLN